MAPLGELSPATATPPASAWWRRLTPECVFLALALPFGLALLFINPPIQAPDESDHFFRAFQLSEGTVIGERHGTSAGGELPYLVMGIAQMDDIPFHPEKKMTAGLFRKRLDPIFTDWRTATRGYCHFPHTVYYPPIAYVPQATVLALGQRAHLGPLPLMYLARLSVFTLSVVLGWFALRRMPVLPWTLLLFLLAPMSLYLFGSIATDGLLITSAFALMALVLAPRESNPIVSVRELALILALSSLLATAKLVYLPLAAAATAIVAAKLRTWRGRTLLGIAFALVCGVPTLIWGRLASAVYAPGRTDIPIDPTAQSQHVLAHPLSFFGVILQTLHADGRGIYEWFVGTLGWGDTPLPAWYYLVFGAGALLCLVLEGPPARERPLVPSWGKLVMAAAAAASFVLIFAAQYLTWNAPGSDRPIEGICGRYFLPLVPFVLIAFPTLRRRPSPPTAARTLSILLASLGCIVCVVAVVRRFYVG